MIQAWDVDPSNARSYDRNREEDEALSNRSDGRGIVEDRTFASGHGTNRATAAGGPPGGFECDPVSGADGLRLADAAEGLSALADVYWWFRRFVCVLLFQTIHDVALMLSRDYLLTRCRAWRRMSHRSGVEARPGGIMIKRFWLTHG